MLKRLCPAIPLACFLVAAVAAPAQGSSDSLYHEYLLSGAIAGCDHSEAEVQAALTSVPADIQAYDPGFPEALNSALDRRAAGCGESASPNLGPGASGGTVLAPDGSPGPSSSGAAAIFARPLPQGSDPSGITVGAIYLLIVFTGLVAAALAFWPGGKRGAGPR